VSAFCPVPRPSQSGRDPLESDVTLALEQSINIAELVKLLTELVKLGWTRTKFSA
jgi:hypothetical protein